ncbi:MAG TPA: glycosyltransferase family 4 protein, partial [Isosphaeraceae bacterium]|nr:glycosyltransferase family 4 protein [Isosphaeraceae bacterium]
MRTSLSSVSDNLRIALVVSHFHPQESGAERQALLQGAELVRLGHVVHVVTKRVEGLPHEEIIRGIHVHRCVKTSPLGPLFGISFVRGVIQALRRLKPEIDLVHTHQGLWEAVSVGLARSWLGSRPTIVQPASSGYYGEAEELQRTRGSNLLKRCILRNSSFVAISSDIQRQWLALGVPPEKMTRLASGVDAHHFRPGPSSLEAVLPPRPRVMFTGRLHPQKNLDVLLTAWPEVVRQTPAHLILVGWGPERDRLLTRARELHVADSVHVVGPVSDPAEHLRAADLFVLPSIAEGMSNSLLEAMSSRLPCLVSTIGGNRD